MTNSLIFKGTISQTRIAGERGCCSLAFFAWLQRQNNLYSIGRNASNTCL